MTHSNLSLRASGPSSDRVVGVGCGDARGRKSGRGSWAHGLGDTRLAVAAIVFALISVIGLAVWRQTLYSSAVVPGFSFWRTWLIAGLCCAGAAAVGAVLPRLRGRRIRHRVACVHGTTLHKHHGAHRSRLHHLCRPNRARPGPVVHAHLRCHARWEHQCRDRPKEGCPHDRYRPRKARWRPHPELTVSAGRASGSRHSAPTAAPATPAPTGRGSQRTRPAPAAPADGPRAAQPAPERALWCRSEGVGANDRIG